MEKGKSNDHFNKCRRSLWQNSTYFKNKNLREFRTRGYILNIIKVTYEKPIVSTILTGGKNNNHIENKECDKAAHCTHSCVILCTKHYLVQ